MKSIFAFLLVVLVGSSLFHHAAFAESTPQQQIYELFADRNYAEAIAQLQSLLDQHIRGEAEFLYLTGNAYLYQQRYEAAIPWYQKVDEKFPDSPWRQKALFKQAECYLRLKQFQPAEELYEREAAHLVSPERKERIAQVYLQFAEEYFTGNWVKRHRQQGFEEQPDYAKAKTFYQLALQMEISPQKAEEVRFHIARCDFALAHYGEATTVLRSLQHDYPGGMYVTKATYYLGRSYLRQEQMLQARRVFRDFIAAYPTDPHAPEAAFLISRTYHIPTPLSDETLELGVKSLQDFLEHYPDEPRAAQAEYEIGLSYANSGRYDDAIREFTAYLQRHEQTTPHDTKKEQDAELLQPVQSSDAGDSGIFTVQDALPSVRYHLGKIYQEQRKFREAIEVWQAYLQKYPSHEQWSEVQRQILITENLIADALFEEKKYAASRKTWEQFLADHPLDPGNPYIMYHIGETFAQEEQYQEAIAQWKRTVSKYPDTDAASQAQYNIGRLLETKLFRFQAAVEAYKRLTWGAYSDNAQERLENMQAKRLGVLTERNFRTSETPVLHVTTRNIEKLTLKMYKVDLETYFRKVQTTEGVDTLDIALIDPDKTWQETIENYERYREFENQFSMPFSTPGAYLVTCSEELVSGDELGYEATTFVLVSDLDIIVKSTKRDALVFAQNMRTGTVYPGVRLLFSDGQKIFFEGTTQKDGVLHQAFEELKNMEDLRVFAYDGTHYASSDLQISELHYVAGLEARGYIYTDRPVYRPGQQIHIKGILRQVDEQGNFQVPHATSPEQAYTVRVVSSQGTPVYQEDVPLSEFGSFAVDFPLSAAAPAGTYRILVRRGKQQYDGEFQVEQYKRERVKLTLVTERDVYFRGETITGTIRAEYYYGEPLKEKPVTYSLAGQESVSAVTDAAGEIAFSFSTRDFAESQSITLHARLDDENVQAAKNLWLTTRGFSCAVNTMRDVYLVGEEIDVSMHTSGPTGKPLAKALTLKVLKREDTVYGDAEVMVEEHALSTGENGEGRARIQLAASGTYVLRAEGQDRFGNPVSGQSELFISGKDDEIRLRLMTDTEVLYVGEQPEIGLFSRASAGLGLLTCEGEAILSYQVFDIQPGRNPLQFEMTSAHAPNFTLSVAQMEGNRFHEASKEFTVIQQLDIALGVKGPGGSEPLEFFEPGDTLTVKIRTTDQNGAPVAAELSLALVDESLFAQYAEQIPPIQSFFYDQRRELVSKTNSSCTFNFEAETQEIVTELVEEEARLEEEESDEEFLNADEMSLSEDVTALKSRKEPNLLESLISLENLLIAPPSPSGKQGQEGSGEFLSALREYFPETGYWNPRIVTDHNGKATITITLPDSITAWRLTGRGITTGTLVGETTSPIVTKLPFFAELKVPALLVQGDQPTFLASIHNSSGSKQDARIIFTGSANGDVLTQQEQTLSLNDQDVAELGYSIEPGTTEEPTPVTVELEANAGVLQDRIKRKVPVRPWGIEYVTTKSGTLRDSHTISISLPEDHEYHSLSMDILINPSLDRLLVELTQEQPWPFKCPSSSRVYEAQIIVNALQYLEPADPIGTAHSDPIIRELQARLKAILTEISLTQNPDGGWNWTGSERRSDPFVSSDAIVLLSQAKQQGYQVQSNTVNNGIQYLKQTFQSVRDNDIKTYLLYALTRADSADFAHINRVYRERHSLSTPALALLTMIYRNLNRPEIAAELNTILQQRAQVQRDQSTGEQTVSWPSDSSYPWLQGKVEMTALALSALQAAEPNSQRIAEVANWLYAARQWGGWGSMRANARVSSALLTHLTETRYQTNHYMLSVSVNEHLLAELQVSGEQGRVPVQIPGSILKNGQNVISFDFQGRGTANYLCVLRGTTRDVSKTREPYEVSRYYEPAPLVFNGQEISRGFSVLEGSYAPWKNKVTQIPLGGFARVTLEQNRREYDNEHPYTNERVILEEPIPAGCSVLEQSIQGDYLDYEIADGRIIFYLRNANYGRVSYNLYGYLPGRYQVLPTKIQSPYAPELLNYGAPYAVQVLERGQTVTETYKKTPDELYYYGKGLFEKEQYAQARPLLHELLTEYRLKAEPYRETTRMLMYIAIAENNSDDIVQYFEILKEKYPNLVLSFEDILRVGQAYRDIQEYERAVQVFRATAEASFFKDVQVSGALEAQDEFLSSVAYTRKLLQEYPDIPTTETAFYALSQLLFTEAERMRQNPEAYRHTSLSRDAILRRATEMLHQFLACYPENPIVDEVSFSLANAYLELEDFGAVVTVARRFQHRYPKSPYFSGYQYIEGYADFELEQYEESLTLCRDVATRKFPDKNGKMVVSPHKDLARYIMGQIYHSLGKPAQAITEYEKVQDLFPDAREAMEYFTRKGLTLDEVTTFQPGEETQVTLSYRNVKKANVLAYRVDLMKLYLLQKNLNNITKINLAGITPYYQETIELGAGRDYADREYALALPLQEEGAYLLVAKEAELDTSGMVLLSRLTLDVEEDEISGRVRVNVKNAENGRYENKVHVKVIGSRDTEFVSGSTDLRGIFIADNIHGAATVIARKGDQYAFYRGKALLQASGADRHPLIVSPEDMRSQAVQQLRATNQILQQQSEGYLRNKLYQNTQTGVEVQATY